MFTEKPPPNAALDNPADALTEELRESLPRGSSASPPITISSRGWYIQSWAHGPRAIFYERVFTPDEEFHRASRILPSLSYLPCESLWHYRDFEGIWNALQFCSISFSLFFLDSPYSRSVLLSAPLFAHLVCNPLFLMPSSRPSFRVRSEYRDVARNRKERREGEKVRRMGKPLESGNLTEARWDKIALRLGWCSCGSPYNSAATLNEPPFRRVNTSRAMHPHETFKKMPGSRTKKALDSSFVTLQ